MAGSVYSEEVEGGRDPDIAFGPRRVKVGRGTEEHSGVTTAKLNGVNTRYSYCGCKVLVGRKRADRTRPAEGLRPQPSPAAARVLKGRTETRSATLSKSSLTVPLRSLSDENEGGFSSSQSGYEGVCLDETVASTRFGTNPLLPPTDIDFLRQLPTATVRCISHVTYCLSNPHVSSWYPLLSRPRTTP